MSGFPGHGWVRWIKSSVGVKARYLVAGECGTCEVGGKTSVRSDIVIFAGCANEEAILNSTCFRKLERRDCC